MEYLSITIALISVFLSIVTYISTVIHDKKKATIDAFSLLQSEVLDKFVVLDSDNARIIIENIDNKDCKEAYDDYRALIARLEHFSVGVQTGIYDFQIVRKLAGEHLVYLYKKIKPIIERVNNNKNDNLHYSYYVGLVNKLNKKYCIRL